MKKLDEIEARLKAATPGPWGHDDGHVLVKGDCGFQSTPSQYHWECPEDGYNIPEPMDADNDCEFIANAPTDIAYLIARVKKLEGALEKYADKDRWFYSEKGSACFVLLSSEEGIDIARKALESEPGE